MVSATPFAMTTPLRIDSSPYELATCPIARASAPPLTDRFSGSRLASCAAPSRRVNVRFEKMMYVFGRTGRHTGDLRFRGSPFDARMEVERRNDYRLRSNLCQARARRG